MLRLTCLWRLLCEFGSPYVRLHTSSFVFLNVCVNISPFLYVFNYSYSLFTCYYYSFWGFGGILLKILGPVRKFKLLCLVTCLDYVKLLYVHVLKFSIIWFLIPKS